MNILYICDEYPPGMNGGIGTMVRVLGRELVRQGHRVTVVGLYPYYYGQADYEVDQGVEVYRLRYGMNFGVGKRRLNKIESRLPGFIKTYLNRKKAFRRFIKEINHLIDNKSIDIIEIPDWNTFAYDMGFVIKWPIFSVPMVLKLHGSYTYFTHETKDLINRRRREIDRILLEERSDAVVAVSKYTANVNQHLFKVNKNIHVLYNGIEIRKGGANNKKKDKQLIIFSGTLVPKKGIFSLIKAWNIIIKKYPKAKLAIYGKGEQKPLIELLSKDAIASVTFFGHVLRTKLFEQLSTATLAVFPSYAETFGLAAVEAMSVGCPTLFTLKTSGPEIITDGVDGGLVDPDNIQEIADKIIDLIENEDLQKKYSWAGRKKVEEFFNIERSAKEHITYYQTVIHSFKHKI